MPYSDPEKRAESKRRAASKRYAKDPAGENLRRHVQKVRKLYGVDYNEMVAAAGGVCEACGSAPQGRRLSVDHNHATGAVRGLLCSPCNVALGMLKEDIGRFAALLSYLVERTPDEQG